MHRINGEFSIDDIEEIFAALGRSEFRNRFRLSYKDSLYLREKGLAMIEEHSRRFIKERLAAAEPLNDGRQTPMRGHPVFTAQHATATCCRGCLEKWHQIPKGAELSAEQVEYIVKLIGRWLQRC